MAPNLHLAAYQTDLAHNLGSMIRLSACFGVTLDIIGPCGFPLSEKSLKEASLDYGEKCEMVLHSDWSNFKKTSTNRRLILLSTKAKKNLWDFDFNLNDTLIMGRETQGVTDEVYGQCDASVTIPMPGGGRSLNVAISAGIAISEAIRKISTNGNKS